MAEGMLGRTAPAMAPLPPLTEAELRSFTANGFLVKRGALSLALCQAARDRLWAGNTSAHLRRDEPASWCGGIPEEDRLSTPDGLNDRTSAHAWLQPESRPSPHRLPSPLAAASWQLLAVSAG